MWGTYALMALLLGGLLVVFVRTITHVMQQDCGKGLESFVVSNVLDSEIDVPAWAELSLESQYQLLSGLTDVSRYIGARGPRIEVLRVLVSLSRDFLNHRDGIQKTSTEEVKEVPHGVA